MYATAIRIRGLRQANELDLDELEPTVQLPPGPEGVALADGLTLFGATLNGESLPAALRCLGLAGFEGGFEVLEEDGFPVQVSLDNATNVRSLLTESAQRRVTVFVHMALDPPLFGRLRGFAARDPRLVTALGQQPTLGVKIGWLFTRDHSVASLAIHEVMVGESSFSVNERPPWMAPLLQEVGRRFARVSWADDAASLSGRFHKASLSPDPKVRQRFRAASRALANEPFRLGELEIVATGNGVEACLGEELMRIRQFGPAAMEALRLVEAVHLVAPDVLVVEAPGMACPNTQKIQEWLSANTSGPEATLEQVFFVPGGAA